MEYKENLIESALSVGGRKIANIGKRAGIHAFFFVQGTKFLKEGGRFGFIVSSSWLDSKYGVGLEEFFLKNYKIITIIESKVERWFAEADVNTCIVILEKCSDQKERDENLVRFVYLKQKLQNFIPPASDKKEGELKRQHVIEDFCDTILGHRKIYENDDFRIYPISQAELWEEGFDADENKFEGANWGKYLRAPDIFFQILDKCKDILVPLSELAKVRFGIKTGANEFFYLLESEIKRKRIEQRFVSHINNAAKVIDNKVLVRGQELSSPTIEPDKLKHFVLFISESRANLKGTHLEKYILHGEKHHKFHSRPTCASREPSRNWFDLGENINDLIAFPQRFRQRHIVFYNPRRVSLNKNLYGVEPIETGLDKALALVLNSTLIAFWLEIVARQPGGGGGPLDADVYIVAKLLLPNIEYLKKYRSRIEAISLLLRETQTLFEELGANSPDEVTFEKVKPDRLELDKIVIQDILGLSADEHLEIYRAVVDLVRSRLDKAKSVGKKGKKAEASLENAIRANVTEEFWNE